ncbi:MAG: hypothetical protein K9K88_09350 [Desulfobacterales bacterium]|nr:hypothetical protein [Desulfobacterales bacterium]
MDEVVRYFSRIYRIQVGAHADTPGRIEPLEQEPGISDRRFRLGVQTGGNWKWRYMTIRPIGEDTGSKSQCFYVIYDTHIVVKIPPVPIRDFSDYIRRIQFEAEIVRVLAPQKCIIPNVSVILRMVHRLDDRRPRSEQQIEEDYLRLAERSPGLQQCLKIEKEFAFFMDLSRDYFLSHALSGPARENLNAVMAEDARLIDDCGGFEIRFGVEHTWICLEIQNLYRKFANMLRSGMSEADRRAVGAHQEKEWFYLRLIDPSAELRGGSDGAARAAGELLTHLFESGKKSVVAYRGIARPHAEQICFNRTHLIKEALSSNLMDLLAWLEQRRVALRDLKPDNLLVCGEPARYPGFLKSAGDFSIGLIDLETAVFCPTDGNSRPAQPQLGGTPTYATPSHFLPNKILERIYPDLWEVFFLQDMHAVVGIIFRVVTARGLFPKSSELFPEFLQALKESSSRQDAMEEVYRRHNAKFWTTARTEFSERTFRYGRFLDAASTAVPASILQMLAGFLEDQRQEIKRRILSEVHGQDLIQSKTTRKELCSCSKEAVCRAMEKARRTDDPKAEEFCRFLRSLEKIKERHERLERLLRNIGSSRGRKPISKLLAAMFERVSAGLNVEEGACSLLAPVETGSGTASGEEGRDASLNYTHTADF